MPGAIEDVGDAMALTGRIVELCTVLVHVAKNASSVESARSPTASTLLEYQECRMLEPR